MSFLLSLSNLLAQNRLILNSDEFILNITPNSITEFQFPDTVRAVITDNDSITAKIIGSHAFVHFPDFKNRAKVFVIFGMDSSVAIGCVRKLGSPSKYEFVNPPSPLRHEKLLKAPPPSEFSRLVRGMYLGTQVSGYKVKDYGLIKEFPLNDSLNKILKVKVFREYYSQKAYGYVLQAIAKKDIFLKEKDFYFVGLKGIYIQKHRLKKGEKTILLVITDRRVIGRKDEDSAIDK